jgi:nitrate reductase beta subunit
MAYLANYTCPHCLNPNYVSLVPASALATGTNPVAVTTVAAGSGSFYHCSSCQANFTSTTSYP